jgi:hypothetical protein
LLHDFVISISPEPHLFYLGLEAGNLSLKLFYIIFGSLTDGPLRLSIVGTLPFQLLSRQ